MNIVCDSKYTPEKELLEKMKQGAELCIKAEGLDPTNMEVSLTFVSGAEMQELNQLYRGENKKTDVLSFPQYEGLHQIKEGLQQNKSQGEISQKENRLEIPLGDVVICTEQALQQADELGHSNERELVYLFIHSICHLLGFDHMNEKEKENMRQREEEIMTTIGVER